MADSFNIIINLQAKGLDVVEKVEKAVAESVGRMAKAVEDASKRMDAALTGAFKKAEVIGKAFDLLSKQAGSVAVASRQTAAGLVEVSVSATRAGSAASAAAKGLNQVKDAVAASGAAAKAQTAHVKALDDRLRGAADAAKLFAIGAGAGLARSLSSGPLLQGLKGVMGGIGDVFQGLNRRVGFINVRGGIFGGLVNAAASSAAMVTRIVANIGGNVLQAAGKIAGGAVRIVSGIPIAIGTSLAAGFSLAAFRLSGFFGLLSAGIGGALAVATGLFSAFTQVVAGSLEAIGKIAAGVFEGAVRFVATFVEGAVRILTKLLNTAIRIFQQLASFVSEVLGKALGLVSAAAAKVGGFLARMFEEAVTEAGKFQTAMLRVFGQLDKVPTPKIKFDLELDARRIAKETGIIATTVAQSMRDVQSGIAPKAIAAAGGLGKFADEIAKLKLAEPFADLPHVTDLVVQTFNAFRNEGFKVNEISRLLFDTARLGVFTLDDLATGFGRVAGQAGAAGLKLEDTLRTLAATSRVLGKEAAFTGVRNLITVIGLPKGEQAKELEDLGIPVRELPPRVKAMVEQVSGELERLRAMLTEFQPGVLRAGRLVGRVTRVEDLSKEQVTEQIRARENELEKLNLQGPIRQLSDFVLQIAKVASESDEAAASIGKIFPNIRGRAGFGALAQQLKADPKFFEEMEQGISRTSTRLDDHVKEVRKSYETQLNRMKRAWEDFQIAVGKPFLPSMTGAFEKLAGVLERLQQRFLKVFDLDATGKKLDAFLSRVIAKFEELAGGAIDRLPGMIEKVGTFFENSAKSVKGFFDGVQRGEGFVGKLKTGVDDLFRSLSGLKPGEMFDAAKVGRFDVVFKALEAGAVETFARIESAVAGFARNIVSAMKDALPGIRDFLSSFLHITLESLKLIRDAMADIFVPLGTLLGGGLAKRMTGADLKDRLNELFKQAEAKPKGDPFRKAVYEGFRAVPGLTSFISGAPGSSLTKLGAESTRMVARSVNRELIKADLGGDPGIQELLERWNAIDDIKALVKDISESTKFDPDKIVADFGKMFDERILGLPTVSMPPQPILPAPTTTQALGAQPLQAAAPAGVPLDILAGVLGNAFDPVTVEFHRSMMGMADRVVGAMERGANKSGDLAEKLRQGAVGGLQEVRAAIEKLNADEAARKADVAARAAEVLALLAGNTEILKGLLERQGIPRAAIEREQGRDVFGLSGIVGAIFAQLPVGPVGGDGASAIGEFKKAQEAAAERQRQAAEAQKAAADEAERQRQAIINATQATAENTRQASQFLLDALGGEDFLASKRAEEARQVKESLGVPEGTAWEPSRMAMRNPRVMFREIQRDFPGSARKDILAAEAQRLQGLIPQAPEAAKALGGVAEHGEHAAAALDGFAKRLEAGGVPSGARAPAGGGGAGAPVIGPEMLRERQGPPRRDEGLPPREREQDFQSRFHEWSEAQKGQGTLEEQRRQRIEEWRRQGIWPEGLPPEEEPVGPSGRPASAEWQWEPSVPQGKKGPEPFDMAAPREPRVPTPPFEGLSMAEIIKALAPKEDVSLDLAESAKGLAATAEKGMEVVTASQEQANEALVATDQALAEGFAALSASNAETVIESRRIQDQIRQALPGLLAYG